MSAAKNGKRPTVKEQEPRTYVQVETGIYRYKDLDNEISYHERPWIIGRNGKPVRTYRALGCARQLAQRRWPEIELAAKKGGACLGRIGEERLEVFEPGAGGQGGSVKSRKIKSPRNMVLVRLLAPIIGPDPNSGGSVWCLVAATRRPMVSGAPSRSPSQALSGGSSRARSLNHAKDFEIFFGSGHVTSS